MSAPDNQYRERLLLATLDGIADVGWAELTIAGIVKRARVSKRTFYEHFATKDACLLALYEGASKLLLDDLDRAIERLPRGEARIAAGAAVYLARLQERPRVIRTLFLEILHLGDDGLAIRRRVMRRFAAFLRREINAARAEPISTAVAMMIVGGINELMLEAFEADRVDRIGELAAPIAELVGSVLHAGVTAPAFALTAASRDRGHGRAR